MSRRTPIKELIAEDAGTPSSPIRRSTRIATRRPSAHEDGASQKVKSQDIDDSDQVSVSSTSSAGSKLGRKTRTSSKSPVPEDVNKIPARRTRKGSTSSLIEEELASNNRVGSPTPGRLTRRSLARSLSVSPTSELESTARKTSTPQKRVIESTTTRSGSIKRGRRLSASDSVAPLESIKELELSPLKENSSQSSIENTNEKDLPVKKKKSALLQPIYEQSFTENNENDKTENKNEDKGTESKSNIDTLNKEEQSKSSVSLKPKQNTHSSIEEKELVIVLNGIDNEKTRNKSDKEELNQDKSFDQSENTTGNSNSETPETRKSSSLKPEDKIKSPSPGKELIVVLSSVDDIDKSHDKSLSPNENTSTNANLNSEKRKNRKSLSLIPEDKSKSLSPKKELMVVLSSTDDIESSRDKSLSPRENISTKVNLNSDRRKDRKSLSLIPEDKSKSPSLKKELIVALNSSTENIDNSQDKITSLNISQSKESVSSERDKGNATLEEENLSLRISEDDEKYDKSLANDSCSNNNSMETDLGKESAVSSQNDKISESNNSMEIISEKESENHLGKDQVSNSSLEVNDEHIENAKTSFCEPMDVDVTASEITLSPPSSKKHEETTSVDIHIPKEAKQSDSEKLNSSEIDANNEPTDCVTLKSSELTPELIKSTAGLKVPVEKSPDKNLESRQHHTSPDQSNIKGETTNTIIVATNLTPVRRSPRIKDSSGKKTNVLSNESVSEDVLSINTPPDSVKSENSLRDTDLEVSGSERHDAVEKVSNDVSKNVENFAEPTDNTVNSQNRDKESFETEICNANHENKSINNISFNSEPELNATLQKKINELTERLEIDSSSDESVSNYIEDMAEEGEEDTPSEGSNDIIDLGESIGSTEYETDSDDELDDSFIDDDEEVQLLSGDEYDLGQEKSKPKAPKKRKRIIEAKDSSDEENNTETVSIMKEVKTHLKLGENNKRKGGENKNDEDAENRNEDSDVENMSTQPYCGLTPPSIVSIRDSPTAEEIKNFNNKDDEESITSVLINKEDNLESLEQIKDQNKHSTSENVNSFSKKESPKKITPVTIRVSKPESKKEKPDSCTPNNSVLETTESQSSSKQQRKRLSSLTIQETVNLQDISNGSVSDRILKVVEVFCSSVTKSGDSASGNISLNVSLDYISTSPDKPNIHEEHKEVIAVEPSSHTLQVPLGTEERALSKSGKGKQKSQITKSSPVKILFTSDDEQQLSKEQGTQKRKTKKIRKKEVNTNTAANEKPTIKSKNKKSVKPKVVEETYSQSDSDMSPDLDKELTKKYSIRVDDGYKHSKKSRKENTIPSSNNQKASRKVIGELEDRPSTLKHPSNKMKHDETAPEEEAPKEKRLKKEEASRKDVWQINYLPHDIKVALSKGKSKKLSKPSIIKSNVEIRIPKKKPKLVPSLNSENQSWNSYDLDTLLRPSSSSEINKDKKTNSFNVEKFHNKDFKNRTLFDSKRVKRMETNELLKKKEKLKI